MSTHRTQGRVISIGYAWRQRLLFSTTEVMFPAGCTLVMHVRASRVATSVLATLTTENGGLTRISDQEIEILIHAAATAEMRVGTVVADLVRTDVSPDDHLGLTLTVPVQTPVTRGLA